MLQAEESDADLSIATKLCSLMGFVLVMEDSDDVKLQIVRDAH